MKNIIFIFLFSMFILACIKEKQSTTAVILKNNTNHSIIIYPYILGSIDSSKIKLISANNEFSIESSFTKGKTKSPISSWKYFESIDSIIVIWDNTYKVTHMISDTFNSSNKFIKLNDIRNIGNYYSYEILSKQNKSQLEWTVTYNFTEQDYLFAKN